MSTEILSELYVLSKARLLEFAPFNVASRNRREFDLSSSRWLRIKVKLPHLRLHDLRHQFASFFVNAGHTIYEVQQILEHSDTKVTERYAHLSLKALEKASGSASTALMGAGRGVAVREVLEAA